MTGPSHAAVGPSRPVRLARLGWALAFIAAAACLVLGIGLWICGRTGLLADAIVARARTELDSYGLRLELDSARLDPFAPGLSLRGARLFDSAGDNLLLELERAHVDIAGPLGGRLVVEHVSIDRGQLHFSEQLDRLLRGARAKPDGREFGLEQLPAVSVRQLEVSLIRASDTLEIGSVDLELQPGTQPRMSGSLQPGAMFGRPVDGERLARIDFFGSRTSNRDWILRSGVRRLELDAQAGSAADLLMALGIQTARAEIDADVELVASSSAGADGATLRLEARNVDATLARGPDQLRDGRIDLSVHYDPRIEANPFDPLAWNVRSNVSATLDDIPIEAQVRAGAAAPTGELLHADLRCERVAIDDRLRSRIAANLDSAGALNILDDTWDALDLEGHVGFAAEVALPKPSSDSGWRAPRVAVEFLPRRELSVAYHGYPDRQGRRIGFPTRARELNGRIGLIVDPEHPGFWGLALASLEGQHKHGAFYADGWIGGRDGSRGTDVVLDLDIERMELDAALRQGLAGLHLDFDLDASFAPTAGGVSGLVRIDNSDRQPGAMLALDLRVDGVDGRWSGLPVPFQDAVGTIELRWSRDARRFELPERRYVRPFGWRAQLSAIGPAGEALRFGGALRGRDLDMQAALPPPRGLTNHGSLRVEAVGFDTESEALAIVLADSAVLAETLERIDLQASIDAHFELQRFANAAVRDDGEALAVDAAPTASRQALELLIRDAAMDSDEWATLDRGAGRAILNGPLGGDAEDAPRIAQGHAPTDLELGERHLRAIVTAEDPSGMRLAAEVERVGSAAFDVDARVAGLSPQRPPPLLAARMQSPPLTGAVDGRVQVALDPAWVTGERDSDTSARTRDGDTIAPTRDGDMSAPPRDGDMSAPPRDGDMSAPPRDYDANARMRDNDLITERAVFSGLHGAIDFDSGAVGAALIEFQFGDTPALVRSLSVAPLPDVDGLSVSGRLFIDDLPLDERHLSEILPAETVAGLIDRLRWRGALDLRGIDFQALLPQDGTPTLEAKGDMVPHDVYLEVGLPFHAGSARVRLERLVAERGSVRFWASVDQLYARLAERPVSNAHAVVSFTDGRLVVSALEADLAGGQLASLGQPGSGATAIAVDFGEPYRFEIALQLTAASVNDLLRGMFLSSVSNRGEIDMSLRLSGSPRELTGLVGSGTIRLFNARLWSIPVIQQLFNLLRFDATATFDEMRTRFTLENGVITLSDAAAKSPLVKLVGGGTLDLDGTLRQDFELTYSLVDRLGPFSKLLYFLQNNLLRISIRGDFGRPDVTLVNFFSSLFRSDKPSIPSLPLAPRGPLGDRF